MKSNAPTKKHVIIGTAGHIDHGKTALVKALTGKDADTLAEEKRRGITIELGFVFLDTPDPDTEILFIDVPGHEKLIKTMVAGASNIDAALFVVAADEGINMQTQEHFDILRILNIPKGIIAVTKSDLVDDEEMAILQEILKEFVKDSFLEHAPILPVSSVTGDGVENIKEALFRISAEGRERTDTGLFRMPIDRVFTMQGFGTVIAGTVLSGEVRTGDEIEIFPDGITTKVRGVQVHSERADRSVIGKRTALNLLGVEKDRLRRGQVAGVAGSLITSDRFDTTLSLLKSSKEIKNLSKLKFYTGTSETICRVVLLNRDRIKPGQTAHAQFILGSELTAQPGDRYVVRTLAYLMTVGGGVILDVNPVKHKRFDQDMIEGLKKLEGDVEDQTEQMIYQSGANAIDLRTIILKVGKLEQDVENALSSLIGKGVVFGSSTEKTRRFLHKKYYEELAQKLVDLVKDHLRKHRDQLAAPYNDLRSEMLKSTDQPTLKFVLDDLIRERIILRKGTDIALCDYEVPLNEKEEEIAAQIEQILIEAGIESPIESKIREQLGMEPEPFKKIMAALINRKKVIRFNPKVTYHVETFAEIREIVLSFIRKKHSMTIAQLRDELGLSRKYAQAILEYFDQAGITKRVGDQHVLPPARDGKG